MDKGEETNKEYADKEKILTKKSFAKEIRKMVFLYLR